MFRAHWRPYLCRLDEHMQVLTFSSSVLSALPSLKLRIGSFFTSTAAQRNVLNLQTQNTSIYCLCSFRGGVQSEASSRKTAHQQAPWTRRGLNWPWKPGHGWRRWKEFPPPPPQVLTTSLTADIKSPAHLQEPEGVHEISSIG